MIAKTQYTHYSLWLVRLKSRIFFFNMEKKTLSTLFGEVLRVYRKKRGFTQEQLAELTDLHDRYISLMERGLRQPTLTTIFKLAQALEISPQELLRLVERNYQKRKRNG